MATMKMAKVIWLACAIAIVFGIGSAKAQSSDVEAARLANQGIKYYNLGEFDKAIETFKKAYEITEDPALLYNLGQVYKAKGTKDDLKHAVFFYNRYLKLSPKAPNKAEVEKKIAELEAEINKQETVAGSGTGAGVVTGTGAEARTGAGAGMETATGPNSSNRGTGIGSSNNIGDHSRDDAKAETDNTIAPGPDVSIGSTAAVRRKRWRFSAATGLAMFDAPLLDRDGALIAFVVSGAYILVSRTIKLDLGISTGYMMRDFISSKKTGAFLLGAPGVRIGVQLRAARNIDIRAELGIGVSHWFTEEGNPYTCDVDPCPATHSLALLGMSGSLGIDYQLSKGFFLSFKPGFTYTGGHVEISRAGNVRWSDLLVGIGYAL